MDGTILIPLKFKYIDPYNIPVKSNGNYRARTNQPRAKGRHIWLKDPKNR